MRLSLNELVRLRFEGERFRLRVDKVNGFVVIGVWLNRVDSEILLESGDDRVAVVSHCRKDAA